MNVKSCRSLAGLVGAIVLLLLFFFSFHSFAYPEIMLDAERQFQFAEQYFQKGEYYRAIGEYERFIYFFPQSDKVELARYRIGLSFLKGERYKEAIQAFNALIEEYRDTQYALKSYLGISEAYVRLKCYDVALTTLTNLITIAPDLPVHVRTQTGQKIRDEAHWKKGWVYLEIGLWEKARDSFEKISPQNRERYNIRQILIELDRKLPLKRKNPTIAGILAIVPGAGHLYCERKRDAFVSFLLNGAMIYAAYEAFDNDLNALGGIITFFELGFYSGNIYSAVSSAHKYNRDEKSKFLNYLKKNSKIKISSVSLNQETSLLLLYQFSF